MAEAKLKTHVEQTRKRTDLHPHPKAEDVPSPEPEQYDEMLQDIEARGMQVPIDILADGTILDGRTRWQIASTLGLEILPVRVIDPPDPYDYMILAAASRRHLTKSQRAALYVQSPTWLKIKQDAADRVKAGTAAADGGSSSKEAGEKIGVGKTTIDEAAGLLKKAPELHKAVVEGDLTTTQAVAITKDKELHDKVRNGILTAKAAAKSIKSEDQRALEHDRKRLRTEAPDLAEAVEKKEITLKGALRILDEREEVLAAEADSSVNGTVDPLPVKPKDDPTDMLPRQLHEAITAIRQAPPRAARNKLPEVIKAMLSAGKPWPKNKEGMIEYRDALGEALGLLEERFKATVAALALAESMNPTTTDEAAPSAS